MKWIVESIQDSVVINLMSSFLYGIIILAWSFAVTLLATPWQQKIRYNYVVDYAEKQVLLLRKHKPNKFNENLDTIEGIDLNAIAIKRG